MADFKRLLVLAIDVDADLLEKAKIRGPVVGRKAVGDAAAKLALADPEESDANTMFQAVKTYDELSGEHTVEIAVLTGSRSLGYAADREIVNQVEKVISDFHPEACVFVSDGASDERVMPLIQSRLKIVSVKSVYIKQNKDLEKTYFVIIDKLKEPQFARIVFGIPGVALGLYYLFGGQGLRVFLGLLGAYLIIKATGIEEWVARGLESARFSFDRVSSVFYFAAIPLAVVAIAIGYSKASAYHGTELLKIAAVFLKELSLLVVALLLTVTGQFLEAYVEKKNFLYPNFMVNASAIVLFWVLFNSASDWVLGAISFPEFFLVLLLIVGVLFLVIFLSREFRKDIVSGLQLEGKAVYTELGTLLGKVVGVNKRKDSFVIETDSGSRIDLDFNHIANVGDKVIIRY
ncbi:DUF373 family protein [Candidatus Micrarchaeota archaeon]|nr:DUF373 family protein [Candidatus Micrarchaeota archaeon]